MSKPTKIISPEVLKHWKLMANTRKNADWEPSSGWADRRLIQVINSHEALRRTVQEGETT